MNHTYASLPPSDSDEIDSASSTPTCETLPRLPLPRSNTIRDLIASYEQQLKSTEALRMPGEFRYPLQKQRSADSVTSGKKRELFRQNSADETNGEINDHVKEHDYYSIERKKVKAELTRTLTEIRKSYIRRVCSTVRRKNKEADESLYLFECCLLVELNMSTLTPFVKGKYPSNYKVPAWVEHLCYPDASDWSPDLMKKLTANQNESRQCFSLVITNEKGERKFGYCRRVLPEEASVCLPLTYCIISSYRAPGFYHKVLKELESRHGLPHWLQNAFLRELYNSKFPKPGQTVKISCLLRVLLEKSPEKHSETNKNTGEFEKIKEETENGGLENDWVVYNRNSFKDYNNELDRNVYDILNKIRLNKTEFAKIDSYIKGFRGTALRVNSPDSKILNSSTVVNFPCTKIYRSNSSSEADINLNACMLKLNLGNSQLVHDCLLGDVVFRRPYDYRIEDTDLTVLFDTLNLDVLLQVFGSILVERKVVFISKSLSQLSSCVEALQSFLYPFSWQHTFIPVLSGNMLDILSAPLPLVAGVLASHLNEELVLEDGIAVNLDSSTVICSMGDEPGILPKRLRTGLSLALQLVTSESSVDGSRNVLVSEAFMRMFVEVCGHYKQFITTNERGENVFDRENFIKYHTSKSVQMFLEWFTETAMFNTFIQSQQTEGADDDSIFEQRCVEFHNEKQKHKGMNMKKVKNFFKT